MIDYEKFPEIVGAAEIEKVVEIELEKGPTYRIEVIHVRKGNLQEYSVNYYERMRLFWKDGALVPEDTPGAISLLAWIPDPQLPYVDQCNPDVALHQALQNLSERRNNANRLF